MMIKRVAVLVAMAITVVPLVYSDVRSCVMANKGPKHCYNEYCYVAICTNDLTLIQGCSKKSKEELAEIDIDPICKESGARYNPNAVKFCNCDDCNVDGAVRCEINPSTGERIGGNGTNNIQCYHGDGSLNGCNGNCLTVPCSNRQHTVKGCAGTATYSEVSNMVEAACQELGQSAILDSFQFCNCDKCNVNEFMCRVKGPTPTTTPTTTTRAKVTTTKATTKATIATTKPTTTTIAITEEQGGDKSHGSTDENSGNSVGSGETAAGEGEDNPNSAMGQQSIYHFCLSIWCFVASLLVACCWQ